MPSDNSPQAKSGEPREWTMTGRVEFHLNGGLTQVAFWAGGLQAVKIDTSVIPLEFRALGTWLKLKLSSANGGTWCVEGAADPDPLVQDWLGSPNRNAGRDSAALHRFGAELQAHFEKYVRENNLNPRNLTRAQAGQIEAEMRRWLEGRRAESDQSK